MFSIAKFLVCITLNSLILSFSLPAFAQTQPSFKKVQLALPTKRVAFLAFYVAHHKGFYRDEGVEFEPILMQPALASTALITGDMDYNGAVTGVIGAGSPRSAYESSAFTVARPLQYLIAKRRAKTPAISRVRRSPAALPAAR